MGLEIVEILMQVEKEFCISIPDEVLSQDFTVGHLQNLACEYYDIGHIEKAIAAMPNNAEDGKIDFKEYEPLWKEFNWLPSPRRIFFKKRYDRDVLLKDLQDKKKYMDAPDLINKKIIKIIQGVLGLKADPKTEDRFIKDLGCG